MTTHNNLIFSNTHGYIKKNNNNKKVTITIKKQKDIQVNRLKEVNRVNKRSRQAPQSQPTHTGRMTRMNPRGPLPIPTGLLAQNSAF